MTRPTTPHKWPNPTARQMSYHCDGTMSCSSVLLLWQPGGYHILAVALCVMPMPYVLLRWHYVLNRFHRPGLRCNFLEEVGRC